MKCIKTNEKIVSLENVKSVQKFTWGSGAKSNPFSYRIDVDYFNGDDCSIFFEEDKKAFEATYEEIYEILTKE